MPALCLCSFYGFILDAGLHHKADLYCALWVGAWTPSQRPLEPLLASDFAIPGRVSGGMKTDVSKSGEVNPVWRAAVKQQVHSREGSGDGGVPNTAVVAWLINKKLVSLHHFAMPSITFDTHFTAVCQG